MDKKRILSILKRIRIPLLVIGLILAVCSPILHQTASDIRQDALQNRQDAIMAVTGQLMPFKMDMSKDFEIDLGNNKMVESAQSLAQGFDILNTFGFGSSFPLQIGFNNNAMSISATIINSNNETVGHITNNNWKSDSPNSLRIGDRNYNDYAFEILDINMVPLFNVRVVGSNEIQIGGLFNTDLGQLLISDNGKGFILGHITQQNITDFLTPLFQYPSSEYTGKLINPTYLGTLPTDTSDQMLSEASLLTTLSYVLAGISVFFIAIFGADSFINFREKESQEKENEQTPKGKQTPSCKRSKQTARRRRKRHPI